MLVRSVRIFSLHHLQSWRPPTDVYETETDVVVQMEIAGMRDGHFHLALNDRHLVVSGYRAGRASERRAYHQMEINSGEFRADVELPAAVDPESVSAEYEDGLFRIALRKL